jgi:hypothetical protein
MGKLSRNLGSTRQDGQPAFPPLHKLCEVCRNIKFDVTTLPAEPNYSEYHTAPVQHRPSLSALERSASSNGVCHLCTLFLSCLRLRDDPERRANWVATSSHKDGSITLAYGKHPENGDEIKVSCDFWYAILKLADIPQSKCSDSDASAITRERKVTKRLLGCIPLPSAPKHQSRKPLFRAITNCHSDDVEIDQESLDYLFKPHSLFRYMPGWV